MEKDLIIIGDNIKNSSIFILNNRLKNSIILKFITAKNIIDFNLCPDDFHLRVMKTIETNYYDEDEIFLEKTNVFDEKYYEDKYTLKNIKTNLNLLQIILNFCKEKNMMTDQQFDFLYEETAYNLCKLGILTIEIDKLSGERPKNFFQPYDDLKILSYDLLDNIDKIYFKINKKRPPNYEVSTENLGFFI